MLVELNKGKFVEIEKWVKYIAQDEDGIWWAYPNKPKQFFGSKSGYWDTYGEIEYLAYDRKPTNWQLELYKITQ